MKHGAEVDVCDERGGITPLHDAVSFGSKEVVEALLQAGRYLGIGRTLILPLNERTGHCPTDSPKE